MEETEKTFEIIAEALEHIKQICTDRKNLEGVPMSDMEALNQIKALANDCMNHIVIMVKKELYDR